MDIFMRYEARRGYGQYVELTEGTLKHLPMDVDDALREVGEFDRYQKLMLWFVLLPAHLTFGAHYYSQLFMSLVPSHWCRGQNGLGANMDKMNATFRSLTLWSRGDENPDNPTIAVCGNQTNSSVDWFREFRFKPSTCPEGVEYERSEFYHEESIVTLWDLVCDSAGLSSLALSTFYFGAFLGECCHRILTNRCGRRASFFSFLALQCLSGFLTILAPDFVYFTVLRFLVGFTSYATISSPSLLAQEIVTEKHRHGMRLASYTARSLGLAFLSCVAYVVREWTHIALVTTLPFMAFFLYWWVFPESPYWLKERGSYEEYGRLLEAIAQANGRELPPDYIINYKRRLRVERSMREERRHNRTETKYALPDLFRSPNMKKKSTAIMFIWFSTTTACVGMNFYSLELEGDVHFNFLMAAGAEIVAVFVIAIAAQKCGRRCIFCLSSALGGGLTLLLATSQSGSTTKLIMFMVAKLSISSSTAILPTWTAELLPLVVRSIGQHLADVVGLLGPILLPFLFNEGRRIPGLTLLTLGSLQLAGAAVALVLPETIHQKVLYTLKDGEQFGKHRTLRDCFRIGPPKLETKNGILKNRGPQQQSPILSLLRRQDSLRRASSEGDPELADIQSESSSSDQGSIIETIKITVV